MRKATLCLLMLACCGLASCGEPGGALVSAQSPAGTGMVNRQSEPQPVGSLPPGAATSGSGIGQAQPTYLQRTFKL